MTAATQTTLSSSLLDSSGGIFKTPSGLLFGWGNPPPSDGTTGWAPGALWIDTASGKVYVNGGDSTGSVLKTVSGYLVSSEIPLADSGGVISAADVENALQEIFTHSIDTPGFLPLPLGSFMEMDASYDVSAHLTGTTTPSLGSINGASDAAQMVSWAAGNVDKIGVQIPLPLDFDSSQDVELHIRARLGGTTDSNVDISVETFWGEGDSKITDTIQDVDGTQWQEKIATIDSKDIDSYSTLTLALVPAAHATDSLDVSLMWLEYSRKLRT